MKPLPEWIVTRVDGKIAAVSADYRIFASVADRIAKTPPEKIDEITCTKVSTEDLFTLAGQTGFEDLMLFGTKFQKMVWQKLFSLTHPDFGKPRLMSYTGFAEYCGCPSGTRAVAHAVAMNPVLVIIPCHLVVQKEAMDRIEETEKEAEESLFGTDGLCIDTSLNFGEYRLGADMKRRLIAAQLSHCSSSCCI